jgi:hypothetical protein
MAIHADLAAHAQNGTSGAFGHYARADMLTERDKQTVDFDPVAFWQFGLQSGRCLIRSIGLDIAPPVRDAVNVDVHADSCLSTGDPQHQVGALDAHAEERQKGL